MDKKYENAFISWRHPWSYILNSKGVLIARSKLNVGWSFFQRDSITIEFDSEPIMKWKIDSFLSMFNNPHKIIYQNGAEILKYTPTTKLSLGFEIEYNGKIITFKRVVDSDNYDIYIDSYKHGHIKHDSDFKVPFKFKKIGTQIETIQTLLRPCILFAIISKDYFGPAT